MFWKRHWPGQAGLELVVPWPWLLLPAGQWGALQSTAWSPAEWLGIGAHWALSPGPGPSLPLGRAFQDACEALSIPQTHLF